MIMEDINKEEIKKWVETWDKASIALLEIKKAELRADDYYEKNYKLLSEMFKYAFKHRKVRFTSGLIEQQRIFMKIHKKQMEEEI